MYTFTIMVHIANVYIKSLPDFSTKAGSSLFHYFSIRKWLQKDNLSFEMRSALKKLGKFRKWAPLWRNFLKKIDQQIWDLRFLTPSLVPKMSQIKGMKKLGQKDKTPKNVALSIDSVPN